jgi:hypothetical protein
MRTVLSARRHPYATGQTSAGEVASSLEVGSERTLSGVFPSATRLFAGLVTDEQFEDFMTIPAYDLLS